MRQERELIAGLSEQQIREIVHQWIKKTLDQYEEIRLRRAQPWSAEQLTAYLNRLDGDIEVYKKKLLQGHYDLVEPGASVFTEDDLQKIFQAPGYNPDNFKQAYKFWVPLIGLYSGMRLEEICQLTIDDIKQIDGTWCFDINNQGDKRIKTNAAKRYVPIHPMLLNELNFLGFVELVKKNGPGRLSPDLKKQSGRYSHYVSRWINGYFYPKPEFPYATTQLIANRNKRCYFICMKALSISGAQDVVLALQDEIRRSDQARYDHRLHALLLVAQGMSCRQAALYLGDSPRTVAYWVHRFEDEGLAGLADADRPGRPRRLNDDQLAEVAEAVRGSPLDYGLESGLWDGKTLSAYISKRFSVELGVRQCQRLFRQLGFRLRKPRPATAGADPVKQKE